MSLSQRWLQLSITVAIVVLTCESVATAGDIGAMFGEHLQRGELAVAEAELRKVLDQEPQQHQARLAVGVVQVLSAIESLGRHQYRYGALTNSVRNVPVLRLPVPTNPTPEDVTYAQVRDIFQDFQTRLMTAEAELAKVDVTQDVKLPLDLMSIALDLTGDGKVGAGETLANVFAVANRPTPGQSPDGLRVTLDAGDVPWLRGYCHFLAGFCDLVLAYDHQRLFDHCGQLVYPNPVPSQAEMELLDDGQGSSSLGTQILDVITAIHLVNLPLKEPRRLESARGHLLEMIRTSRESWRLILTESDNDREWLPNPQQTGVLRMPVTRELIDGWHGVLNEMEDLLEGRKLIPFWRDYARILEPSRPIPMAGRGINLKRFCQEPRDFDLILAIQGTGMLPYLETGPLSRPETWDNLSRVFQGRFFGFAVWFN